MWGCLTVRGLFGLEGGEFFGFSLKTKNFFFHKKVDLKRAWSATAAGKAGVPFEAGNVGDHSAISGDEQGRSADEDQRRGGDEEGREEGRPLLGGQ